MRTFDKGGIPTAALTDTMADGDDPWWAVAATQVHALPAASRDGHMPRTATRASKDASAPRRASVDGEFVPLAPATLAASGISESQIEGLVLKYLLNSGTASGREIADQLKLPFPLISELLRRMKADQLIGYKSSDAINDYVHQLTPQGAERTRRYSEVCTYFGAAPVSLDDYIAGVPQQSLRQHPTADHLRRACPTCHQPHVFNQLDGRPGRRRCSSSPGTGKRQLPSA
jgi:DNA-binding MarR family transcriptional regulator